MGMKLENRKHQVVLVQSAITCIYFAGILLFLHFTDNIYNVGKYKFMSMLVTIVLVEFAKVSFPILQSDQLPTVKTHQIYSTKSKINITKNVKDIIKFTTVAVIATFIYFVTIVLYGAPLLTRHEETLMLALTLTTLTLVPTTFHLGIDNALVLFTGSESLPPGIVLDAVTLNIKAVLLGTWCSAFVIPLDWDRPWQTWPIPCIVGALLGCFAAHFVTFVKMLILKYKKKRKN